MSMYMSLMAPMRPGESVADVLFRQHQGYANKARSFKILYYTTRIIAGVGAALLPFAVPYSQIAATLLAIVVAVVTVFDTVFVPKDKWALYAKTSDHLWLKQVQASGEYEKYKDQIDEIMKAEEADLAFLTSLQDVVARVKKEGAAPPVTNPGKVG